MMLGVRRPVGRFGEVETEVADGPHQCVEFEQGSILRNGIGPDERADRTSPGDSRRPDRRLEQWPPSDRAEKGESFHHRDQPRRPVTIDQLGADGDSTGLGLGELVHDRRVRDSTDIVGEKPVWLG